VRIPNADQAVVDVAKLREYCLNPAHPVGKHKARVFLAALGMTAEDAELLRLELLSGILAADATAEIADQFGRRFMATVRVTCRARAADVCSCWIVRTNEDFPRLVTRYVL
jgi:hypothetical protein